MGEDQETTANKNTVTIEKAGPCKKKIIVEIPEETIKETTNEQYSTLGKDAEVPGFRKGRAPRRLLEKRFGKNITEQVKLKLLSDASEAALKDNELDVLREPDIDYEKIELPDEGSLTFDFEIEVRPEFDLPEIEGIPVTRTKLEVTEDQLTREVEQLQRWSGIWAPRNEGETIQLDDQIIADAVLKVEGVEEDQKLDNIQIYVRPNGFVGAIPVTDLDKLLIDAKAGDVKTTSVEVPKTYFKQEYRGKKVDISIDINDIKWLRPAEIDKDFLSRLGVENEEDLRNGVRDSLQDRLEQQVRTEMTEQIYKHMLENTDFELPIDIVAEQADSLLRRQQISLMQRGMPREKVEEQMEQLKAGSEQQAVEQLKTFFIMDKVGKKLEIEVSDDEVNGQIAQLALQQGQRPEKMREDMIRNGSLGQFKMQVRDEKCVEKLLEMAKITEVEPEKKTKKAKKSKKTAVKSKETTEKAAKTTKKTVKKTEKKSEKTEKKPAKKTKTASKKKTDK